MGLWRQNADIVVKGAMLRYLSSLSAVLAFGCGLSDDYPGHLLSVAHIAMFLEQDRACET
jgi:hypothetical protein